MKTSLCAIVLATLLFSCDPNADKQVGRTNPFGGANPTGGSGGGGATPAGTSGTTADAPIDGGLSILLLAGAAYGVRRARNSKQKNDQA